MTHPSSRPRNVLSGGLAALGIIIALALWLLNAATGLDLGLFEPEETAVPPETSGAGDWYQVYFTEPQDEPTWSGGLDEVLAADIDHATISVWVAAYDLDLQSVTDALLRAHERGVDVKLVTDSDNVDLDQPQDLIDAGIPVVKDGRSAIMHDKFVIIDEVITWTGSWNLTDNGTYRNNNNAIRLLSRRMAGNYEREFREMFDQRAFGPSSPADTPNPLLEFGDSWVETYFAPEDEAMKQVVAVVSAAQQSIRFMAYSFCDDELGSVIRERAAAGVLVEGVFESRNAESDYSEYPAMRDANLHVWLDGNPALLHHKVIIVDSQTVITGSFNLSESADQENDENLLIIHDPDVATLYLDEFDRVIAEAD